MSVYRDEIISFSILWSHWILTAYINKICKLLFLPEVKQMWKKAAEISPVLVLKSKTKCWLQDTHFCWYSVPVQMSVGSFNTLLLQSETSYPVSYVSLVSSKVRRRNRACHYQMQMFTDISCKQSVHCHDLLLVHLDVINWCGKLGEWN